MQGTILAIELRHRPSKLQVILFTLEVLIEEWPIGSLK